MSTDKTQTRQVSVPIITQNQTTCSDRCDHFIDKVFGTVARCTLFNQELKSRPGSKDKWSRAPKCVQAETKE